VLRPNLDIVGGRYRHASLGFGANSRLLKDRDALLTFYDFPAEHWTHLRTSNPIESAFATVRHRTVRMKGALSQDTARLMVFKLVMAASKSWRRLQGQNQLPKVVSGVTFQDGIEVASEKKSAA
jgi:transposase-like protein